MCSVKTGVTAKSFFLARQRGRLKVGSKQGTTLSKFCGDGEKEGGEIGVVVESSNKLI